MNENYYYQHNRDVAILSETNNNNAQTNDMTSQHEISDDTGTSVVSITEEDHDGDEYDDDYFINHDINNNNNNNNSFESHDDDDEDDDIDDEKFNYRYSLTDMNNNNNNNNDRRRASSGEMSSGDEMSVILSPPSPRHGGIGGEDLSILIPQSSSHSILSSSSTTTTTTTTATTSSSSLSITTASTATTGQNNHSSSGRVLLNKKSHGSMTKIHSIQSLPPIVDISSSILSPSSQSPSRSPSSSQSPSRNSSSSNSNNSNYNNSNSSNSNSNSSSSVTTTSDGSTRVHSRYILEALRQSYVEDVQYMKQQSRRFKTTATSSSSTVQQQYAVDQQQADENFMTDEYGEDYDIDVDEYDNDNEDDDELTVVRVRVSNNNNNNSSSNSSSNGNGKRQSVRTTTTTTISTNNNSVALSQMYLNHRKSVSIQSSDHMNSNGSSNSNSASHNNSNNNNNRNSVKLLGRMNHLMWNDRSRSMSTGHLDAHNNNNGHNQNNSNKRNSLLSRKGSSPSAISNTESIFNNMNGYGSSSSNSGNGNSKMGTQKLVVRNYARQLTAQVNLGTLPEELLFVVFTWLEPEDLGRVASVNRIWNRISELDLLWESIAYCYYPDETARAVEIKLETNNSLLSRQPEEPRSRKSIFQTLFTRSNSSSSGSSPLPQPNVAVQQIDIIDYSRLKDCTFFKDIFTQVYASDVQLLRTGLWTSDTWKPKKSPWKKDDYEFVHDKLARTGSHTSLSPTASDMNEMLNGGVSSMNVQVPIKVVVVGDGSVGKTSLLCRYSNNYFPEEDFLPTIFDNFTTSTTYMNQTFNVSLYDTAGTEDYDRLRPLSYIGADIFLLCVDLVNAHSLENGAKKWLEELNKHAPGVPIVLCGTKMDLRIDKKYLTIARRRNVRVAPISYKMGCDVAKKIGAVAYTETSALTGHGVDRAFGCVMRFGCEFFLAQQKHYAKVSNCGIS